MQTTLVTGATGFIGCHLVRALLDEGFTVRALVRNRARARRLPEAVERHFGDLTDPESLVGITDRVHVVFHLGAAMEGDWENHRRTTCEGTRHLLRLSCEAGVQRFIHMSSIQVYDTGSLCNGDVITESSTVSRPEKALGNYARGKVEAELLIREFSAHHGLSTTIVRPGIVYGPGHVIFEHLGKHINGHFIGYGRRDQLLPLVSIQSLIGGLIRILQTRETVGKSYIIVDEHLPRDQYIRLFGKLTGKRYRTINVPLWLSAPVFEALGQMHRRTGLRQLPDTSADKIRSRALSLRYDSSALEKETGWKPPLSLRECLKQSLAGAPAESQAPGIVRVGVIGAGMVFDLHLSALAKVPQVQVVGVLDTQPGRAALAAARYNIRGHYEDPEEFYAEAQPEIVHVLTPPSTHCSVAIDAMRRGVHVLCEKPLAMTVEECRLMDETAKRNGVLLGVNGNYWFDPRVRKAREMVKSGAIGDVLHVEIVFGFDVRRVRHFSVRPGERTHWAYRLPGGLLEDLAPHPLSIALSFLGENARIAYSSVRSTGRVTNDIDDELRLCLESGDATAHVAMSLSILPDDFRITVYGSNATIRIDFQNMLLQRVRLGRGPKPIARGVMVGRSSVKDLYQLIRNVVTLGTRRAFRPGDMTPLFRSSYQSLRTGRALPVSAREGARVVEILRHIWPK